MPLRCDEYWHQKKSVELPLAGLFTQKTWIVVRDLPVLPNLMLLLCCVHQPAFLPQTQMSCVEGQGAVASSRTQGACWLRPTLFSAIQSL